MLEDEVADDHVGDRVLDGVEPAAGDPPELDVGRVDLPRGAVEHHRRHVHGDHAVEAACEQARHPPRAAADLDAGAAAGVGAEPREQ